jgi:fatty-acyl-CoA synthase
MSERSAVGADARAATASLPPFADLDAVAVVEATGLASFAPEMSVYELLARSAELYPQRRALWHYEHGEPEATQSHQTYESLYERVTGAANLFHELGVGRTDVIGYLLPSVPELHELMWGGETAGIACSINHFLEPELIATMLQRVGARVLVVPGADVDAELWEKVQRVRSRLTQVREIVRVGQGDIGVDYRRRIGGIEARRLLMPAPGGEDVAAYFHTGGTTGAPKFAPQTHRRQVIAARIAAYAFGLNDTDVVLSGLPHFHIGGLYAGGLVPFAAGATVVQLGTRGFRDRSIIANCWRLAEETRATAMIAVPTVISTLLEQDFSVCDTRRMRFVISGAAGLPAGLRAAFESRTGVRINEAYGLTEATFVVSMNPWAGASKPSSVGIRLPFVEVRMLADEAGAVAQSLAVRGPTVFSGYLDVDERAQPFRDGWLMTGDLGRMDAEGQIFLSGRSKDLIKRGGHAIDPSLIEEALATHPAVALCAAVGQPEPRLGEVAVVYVKCRAEASVSEQELQEFARLNIPERAAVPKAIRIRAELPRTSVGKIDKAELRRDAAKNALSSALAQVASRYADGSVAIEFRGDTAVVRIRSADRSALDWAREQLRDFTMSLELVAEPA